MILISLFVMILLTSLTGTVILAFWKLVSIELERRGEIGLISSLLWVVLLFHLIPVVFLCLVYWAGVFHEGEAGKLLAATPLLIKITEVLAVVWLVGFFIEVFRYMLQQKVRKVERMIGMPAGGSSREIVRLVRERLHITEEIPVYELADCGCPFITGFLKNRIFIPEEIDNTREMEMILEHELFHYVQRDLYRKKLCAWIVRIQWFNPFAHRLVRQVDSWGDSFCDYHMCYDADGRWDMKEYFDVVIKHTKKKEKSYFYNSMHMGRSKKEIHRRMERMKKVKTKRQFKRVSAFLLTICFLMASAITSLAAGGGMEQLYEQVYEASMVKSYGEELTEEAELEEYTRDRSDYEEIVEMEGEITLDSRGVKTYNWDIKAGVVYETELFWATKGDKIAVTVNPSPATAKTGMGLDQPNGVLRGVTSTGWYGHTFTVEYTGFHRVFVENMESQTIAVGVTVSR